MKNRMRRINCVHFIGIGGSGMSGIAEVMLSLGYDVQGSDLKVNSAIKRLKSLGVKVFIGHSSSNIINTDAVVLSSAIEDINEEVQAARIQGLPIVSRAEMLAELMRFRFSIAVSGTHGKTTTTSLIAHILAEAQLDPTFVIGGCLKNTNENARLGQSEYLVAEADESDASFIQLKPMLSVVTNIDADHMDTYSGDLQILRNTFLQFLHNLPFYGLAILCGDDPGIRLILDEIGRSVITYGISDKVDVKAKNIVFDGEQVSFDVARPNHKDLLHIRTNLSGEHNVQNILAAICVASELGVSDKYLKAALLNFEGIERRFQNLGTIETQNGSLLFIDDYGHHPTEIRETIKAARSSWPDKRIILIFQPHRYSRTRDLIDDFAAELSKVDVLILLEVYDAGEEFIAGADGRSLARAVRSRGSLEPVFLESLEDLPVTLDQLTNDGDLVLTMGAGDIGGWGKKLVNKLPVKETLVANK